MKKFRQKNYSISEGHYTGPKDSEKTPSTVSVLAKGAGIGALTGAVVGKVAGIKNDDISVLGSAWKGAEYGTLSGIALKIFLNYLHNPMKSVKYQEVDKALRREFGIHRISEITVGDTLDRRASIDERFGFNDRNATNYKLTFCISNNKVTMYTFGMSEDELEKTDKILDYYCKKFSGMEYSSMEINGKINAYSVIITFTNYSAISSFIMELSNSLKTRINLLDNDMIARRISESAEETREFSIAGFSKNDVFKVLSMSIKNMTSNLKRKTSFVSSASYIIAELISSTLETISERELAKMNIPVPRHFFGNDYLKKALEDLKYIYGFHFTVGDQKSEANMSLINGMLLITAAKGKTSEKIDKEFWEKTKASVVRTEVDNNVISYSYSTKTKQELNNFLNLLMKTGIHFNIFE